MIRAGLEGRERERPVRLDLPANTTKNERMAGGGYSITAENSVKAPATAGQ